MRRGGKAKTRKAVAKRFKVTGTGKILRRRKGKRHLAENKSRKRKRRLGSPALAADSVVPMLKECMPFDH